MNFSRIFYPNKECVNIVEMQMKESRMKFCKYCNKPIDDESVWNPDKDGNGYHHSCLCEMEFKSRDKRIYDTGRTDVLEKIRAEIKERLTAHNIANTLFAYEILEIIDKYTEQAEGEQNEDRG